MGEQQLATAQPTGIFGEQAYYYAYLVRKHTIVGDALNDAFETQQGRNGVIEMSMAELAASFEDGEVVYLGGSCGEPTELSAMLADPAVKVADAHYVTSFVPGINATCLARPKCGSRMSVFFMQRSFNAALAGGRIEFRSLSYFGIHRYLSDVKTRLDTAIVQVAPPDARGICSLGPAVEFMPTVLSRAARVVGIINPNVPRLRNSPGVSMDRFCAIAHSTAALPTYEVGPASNAAARVVSQLAPLIPHGATVQIGLGKIPSQLLEALTDHREMALHTGMLSDATVRLAQAGALRRHKPLVTAVAVGSEEFYGRLEHLAGLELAEVGHTHSPLTLAGLPRFHAVNSALEVDLLGQVNAESLGGRYISGPGGLSDFAHAAHADAEGLSIVALSATDGAGTTSRIVAQLAPGVPVSLPQHDVDVVVTEYGTALLCGQPVDERARRLCAIAHPDHRPALQSAARGLLR
jgi:acyl-CoA hydrolase